MAIVEAIRYSGMVQTIINRGWGKAYRSKVGIIQAALDALGANTYLEIGVASGDCFSRIKAEQKIAVDPAPQSSFRSQISCISSDDVHLPESLPSEVLFEIPSDDFFTHYARLLGQRPIDVALVDGLHSYKQSLRDVLNCLEHLRAGGVVVMHDCNPASETIGYPAPSFEAAEHLNLPDWNSHWSGDVWKTIVHLRSRRNDLHVFVLDCDMGVGIVTKKRAPTRLLDSTVDVEGLSYSDLSQRRNTLLNLKHPRYFHGFLADLRSWKNRE